MFEGGKPYCYANVKRWAAKVKATGGNIFKLWCMIIPCNISSRNWCLCVADISRKRIQCFDSMKYCSKGLHFMRDLQQYFKNEVGRGTDGTRGGAHALNLCAWCYAYRKKHAGGPSMAHLIDLDSWELISTDMATTPQQDNGSDCGVFTCAFAHYLSLQLKLHFSAADMPYFRQRITL